MRKIKKRYIIIGLLLAFIAIQLSYSMTEEQITGKLFANAGIKDAVIIEEQLVDRTLTFLLCGNNEANETVYVVVAAEKNLFFDRWKFIKTEMIDSADENGALYGESSFFQFYSYLSQYSYRPTVDGLGRCAVLPPGRVLLLWVMAYPFVQIVLIGIAMCLLNKGLDVIHKNGK